MCVESLRYCLTPCDPMDCRPPGLTQSKLGSLLPAIWHGQGWWGGGGRRWRSESLSQRGGRPAGAEARGAEGRTGKAAPWPSRHFAQAWTLRGSWGKPHSESLPPLLAPERSSLTNSSAPRDACHSLPARSPRCQPAPSPAALFSVARGWKCHLLTTTALWPASLVLLRWSPTSGTLCSCVPRPAGHRASAH